MLYLIIYTLIISSVYFFLILYYLSKWISYESDNEEFIEIREKISLLIPVFNEGESLVRLVNSLKDQSLNSKNFEVIIIDDHSKESCKNLFPEASLGEIKLKIVSNRYASGKKYALLTGVENASNQYIVTTDADCIPNRFWLETLLEVVSKYKPKFISAPVKMLYGNSLFQKFQSLEFASLVGIGAASFAANSPIMCNGANLTFDRNLFLEAFSELKPSINTGDDIFLMEYAKKHFPDDIMFIKNTKAIVSTKVESRVSDFAKQRVRWSSKSLFYSDKTLIAVSSLVFLLNLNVVISLILGFWNFNYFYLSLVQYGMKTIVDFFFLSNFLKFLQQKELMRIFVIVQLIYPFYIVSTAVSGLIKSFRYRRVEGFENI